MKKIILLSLICVAIDSGNAVARAVTATDSSPPATNILELTPAFVNGLAEEMRTNNPALLAADSRTNAAAAGLAAVRTWQDPKLLAGGMAADTAMRADNGDIIYGAEQMLPLFGKPAAARRVAQAELGVEMANADYQFQILKSELAKVVFRAALAEQIVAIGEQDLMWLQTMVATTDAKYQSGQATLVESLQVQNEQARRTTQLQTSRENLTHTHVNLNRLLNRQLQSPWPALQLPAIAGPVVYNERLTQLATKYEPKLRLMRKQTEQAEATVDATRRSRMSDVSAGFVGRNYSGTGDFRQAEFMLSFSLPIFNSKKYRADLRRDEARVRTAELESTDYELSLRAEVHNLTVKIDAARREALVYRDQIIPRSEQALTSARAMFESGGMLRDVLDARRMLLEGRLMQARAVAEQYEMLSELVLCCGLGDLEALQMLNSQHGEPKP